MVIDTSALVAILEKEPGFEAYARAISEDTTKLMSTVTFLEAVIVISNKKPSTGRRRLYELLLATGITLVPFDVQQMKKAIEAYLTYGKGRAEAALNFGDCISYALAAQEGEPLLFKGGDFSKTNLKNVL